MAEMQAHLIGTGHCPQCDHMWRGKAAEHCPSCHETFTGASAGDAHRKGDFPDGRYCTTEGLFWNEKRQMWGTTEPGTMPNWWDKNDAEEPETPAPTPAPVPVSFGEPSW